MGYRLNPCVDDRINASPNFSFWPPFGDFARVFGLLQAGRACGPWWSPKTGSQSFGSLV